MKKWMLMLWIGLGAIGCKKDELTFTLQGTVTDATFNTALVGAKVELIEMSVAGSAPNKTVGSTVLGSDGSYRFTFTRNKADSYVLKISKDLYFDIESTIPFASFSTEEPLERNFSTTAMGWARFRFVNQTPASPTDGIEIIKTDGKNNCLTCCPTQPFSHFGTGDTTFVCVNDGNTQIQYYYSVFGTTNQDFVGVVTVPFDTVEAVVYY